ncbi:Lrp/AsnC family transcriptional regulator [Pinisolibacter sp.]|jgi:Lrp/AsnC family transcriptional regulator|uniref:Lrp/AsnC family transcriptional regulator n=1 Tax=Pinisolibacter sp. TaxID=2172024 RepID=UPI002FDE65F0
MPEKILLDAHDVRILRVLQRDASLAIADIAKEAGMSQTPCWRRIKRMKDAGVIKQIAALVDREAVGLEFVVYTFVKLGVPSLDNMTEFDRKVATWPEVITCERVTGAVDYLIKVVAEDMKAYDTFLRMKLLDNNLVTDVQSHIVVATVKDTPSLPLREN